MLKCKIPFLTSEGGFPSSELIRRRVFSLLTKHKGQMELLGELRNKTFTEKLGLVRRVSQRITGSSMRTQTSPQDSPKTCCLLSCMYSTRKKEVCGHAHMWGSFLTESHVSRFPTRGDDIFFHTCTFSGSAMTVLSHHTLIPTEYPYPARLQQLSP